MVLAVGETDKYLNLVTKQGLYEIPNTEQKDLGQDRFVLQQFTGLTDKNGKEIYEGDIMTGRPNPIEVRYEPPEFRFIYKHVDSKFCDYWHVGWADFEGEIIGNIFQNPELLK